MADVLLVIDVQQALVDELAMERRAALLGTLQGLLGRARARGVPVVYVRHDGSPDELIRGTPGWQIASEIAPSEGEPVVDKRFSDSFRETPLAGVLAQYGADHVIAAGMQTDFCVAATVREAAQRGYAVTLVDDGHATYASAGRSEEEIRAEMHADVRARGVALRPAGALFVAPAG
jgi:nicotinamidase-related amidase